MLRRALATAAVSAVAVVGLAPAASALPIPGIGQIIAVADCDLVKHGLTALNLVDEDTTRNELAAKLREETRTFASGTLANIVIGDYANQIADRALVCEIVKADPQNPLSGSSEFLEMIGGLSSNLNK